MSGAATTAAAARAAAAALSATAASARPHPYATSHPLVDVDLHLPDGSTVRAVVKQTSGRLRDRPSFVQDEGREAAAYRRLLLPSGAWAPRLLGAAPGYLILERSDGVPLWQCKWDGLAERLGRSLRALHDTLAHRAGAAFLTRYDRRHYNRWFERACSADPIARELEEAHAMATARLLAEPVLVIHGELYPSNVLVRAGSIRFLDWETAAAGPAVVDLAALVSGSRAKHVDDVLTAYGGVDPLALDSARLHLALRWLGWSRRWRPPIEHARDWLAEARDAAARLTDASVG